MDLFTIFLDFSVNVFVFPGDSFAFLLDFTQSKSSLRGSHGLSARRTKSNRP